MNSVLTTVGLYGEIHTRDHRQRTSPIHRSNAC